MTRRHTQFYSSRRYILILLILVVSVYILLPQVGGFHSSWRLLSRAGTAYTSIAVLFTFATFAASAGTYRFLAFRHLSYLRTVLVELAATFVNRLLPAGIGAVGANYLYLRHERHSPSQAATMAAVNNLLGLTGHGLSLLAIALLFSSSPRPRLDWHGPGGAFLVRAGLAVLVALVFALLFFGRRRVAKTLSDIKTQLVSYRRRPWSLVGAQTTSIALTMCNVACLFFCAHALSLQLPFIAVFIVFTMGVTLGAIVPTPGGLGGFEAGLAAGFVAYGIDPAPALATALLYRLVSYWLPMIAGAAAFAVCQGRGLFEAAK